MLCADHRLCSHRTVCDRLCSGPVPDPDGELLQAGRDVLRRHDQLLLSSDELLW